MTTEPPALVVLCGPTASGKSALALRLAEHFPCEIISADSRQVYRGLNIGTAKPSAAELAQVPHHLTDVVDLHQPFNAGDFALRAHSIIDDIRSRGRLPLIVGGTGLYLQVLISGMADLPGADEPLRQQLHAIEARDGVGSLHKQLQLVDPEMAVRLQPRDTIRIVRALEVFAATGQQLSSLQRQHDFSAQQYRVLWLGMDVARSELYQRIEARVDLMIRAGLVAEVEGLLAQGYSPELKALKTIGYQEILRYMKAELSLEDAISMVKVNSRRYAKRQMTWFRKNSEIIWVDSCREFAKITKLIKCFNA